MRIPIGQLDVVKAGKPGGKKGGGGNPPPSNTHVIPSDEQGDEQGDASGEGGEGGGDPRGKGKGNKGSDKIKKIDKINTQDEMIDGDQDHDVLDGSDQGNNKNTVLKDIKDVSKQAQRETERQQAQNIGRGQSATTPLPTVVDFDKRNYKDVLKDLFSQSSPTGPRSYTNPIRRYAASSYAPPGRVVKKQLNNFILALDTSGSITVGMISKFIGTAQRIAEQFKHNNLNIKILLYHHEVYKEKDFNPNEMRGTQLSVWLKQNIDKTGGNYFSAIVNYISSIKGIQTYKGAIFLTDGQEAFQPFKLPPLKHIFLIDGQIMDGGEAEKFLKYVQKQRPAGKAVDIYQINCNI